jgi:hypothetical protein
MEKERVDSLVAEAREIATRTGDLRSLTMLRLLESARPGLVQPAEDWTRASDEAIALADESADDGLRVAIRAAGSYAYLCAGDYNECGRLLDEALEIAGDDHSAGNGIVIGCPYAWALMAQACISRDRGDYDASEELFERALRIASEQGDPETESWSRGNLAVLLALRGDLDAALGLAQRNYELTERLGDVFSRHWALLHLGFVQLERGDAEDALRSLERADSLYREAMATGGEVEAWREALIAEALLGVGRKAEALERAENAAALAKERGLLWSLSRGLRVFAEARIATGEPGAGELLDEAERTARAIGQMIELQEIERARNAAPAAQA